MAKLKKAPGRLIGRWKAEAITANASASDEDLAKVINEMAKLQGYNYTITPDKIRMKTKKKRKKRKHARTPASATSTARAPTSKPAATAGISVGDIEAIKGLVERIGADNVQELPGCWPSRAGNRRRIKATHATAGRGTMMPRLRPPDLGLASPCRRLGQPLPQPSARRLAQAVLRG
jgi:hypothetical protein